MFSDKIYELIGIRLTPIQLEQFTNYYQFLIEYNQHTNLTRITDEKEVYYKHFYDSLLLAKSVDMTKVETICDMGAGAGFPSIPLKIVYPHLTVTIVDSLNKRITFLTQLAERLNLERVIFIHDRAELFAHKHQAKFDLVTARALGALDLIVEMGLPMVKVGGRMIAPKSAKYQVEIDEALSLIKQVGGKIDKIDEIELPFDYGFRVNITINKIKHVSGFPRTYAQMLKNRG